MNYCKENVDNKSLKEAMILLIEDDPGHAELIADIFKENNEEDIKPEVILKKDGQEAVDYFQYEMQSQPSLVILDLNLPKNCGMDVLRFIKKNPEYYSIPVIIFSTSFDQETIDEAFKNGANGYIIKPDSYNAFVEKIKILKEYF